MVEDDFEARTRRAHAKLRAAMLVIAGVTLAIPTLAGGSGKGASTAQAKGKPNVSVVIRQ